MEPYLIFDFFINAGNIRDDAIAISEFLIKKSTLVPCEFVISL